MALVLHPLPQQLFMFSSSTEGKFHLELDSLLHTKLMRRYKQVPEWWFVCILIANIAVTIFACEYYIEQLQLPWWGVLLACAIAFFFTLPIGIITATTNQVQIKF
jgi:hypothetical protein